MTQNKTILWVIQAIIIGSILLYIGLLIHHAYVPDVPFSSMAKAIQKSTHKSKLVKGTDKDLLRLYGLNANDLNHYNLQISKESMNVNEILLLQVKNKNQTDTVKQALTNHLDQQKKSYNGYGASQMKLLNHAILKVRGNYLLFVVFPDVDPIYQAFTKSIS